MGIAQKVGGGSTDVSQRLKERFLASIAYIEAHLTILSVQRSDKGTYQFQASVLTLDTYQIQLIWKYSVSLFL